MTRPGTHSLPPNRTQESQDAAAPLAPAYCVVGIGLPRDDRAALAAGFERAKDRNIRYRLGGLRERADIILVNADEPGALARWVRYRLQAGTSPEPASVVVSRQRSFNTKHFQARGPLSTEATLGLLDQVARKAFGIRTETAIDTSATAGDVAPTNFAVRILVVDDSLPVRVQMRQALRNIAAHIDFAADGHTAMALFEEYHYDMVFLDIYLPGLDGYTVCQRMKDEAPNVPVVMLTGASSPADRTRAMLAGCDTFLIKPVASRILGELLGQYLGSARPPTHS